MIAPEKPDTVFVIQNEVKDPLIPKQIKGIPRCARNDTVNNTQIFGDKDPFLLF
jgi:hypothetical protein